MNLFILEAGEVASQVRQRNGQLVGMDRLLFAQVLHEGGDRCGRGQLGEVDQTASDGAEELLPENEQQSELKLC